MVKDQALQYIWFLRLQKGYKSLTNQTQTKVTSLIMQIDESPAQKQTTTKTLQEIIRTSYIDFFSTATDSKQETVKSDCKEKEVRKNQYLCTRGGLHSLCR